jgi:hypothetical protein
MAMTEFTLEGEVLLGNFDDGNHIRVDGERLEDLISRNIGFPSEEEFDEMINRIGQLREDGLTIAEGEPNILREGTRLKISVEVLNGEDSE